MTLTYADYLEFPVDGMRHELVDGEHIVNPPPNLNHQTVLGNLYELVLELKHGGRARVLLAPCAVQLSPRDVVEPDLFAVAVENSHRLSLQRVTGPPDLCVEILSPGTSRYDLGRKLRLYERSGVREYWAVDAARRVLHQHWLDGQRFAVHEVADGIVCSRAFPGFDFALKRLFVDLL